MRPTVMATILCFSLFSLLAALCFAEPLSSRALLHATKKHSLFHFHFFFSAAFRRGLKVGPLAAVVSGAALAAGRAGLTPRFATALVFFAGDFLGFLAAIGEAEADVFSFSSAGAIGGAAIEAAPKDLPAQEANNVASAS